MVLSMSTNLNRVMLLFTLYIYSPRLFEECGGLPQNGLLQAPNTGILECQSGISGQPSKQCIDELIY